MVMFAADALLGAAGKGADGAVSVRVDGSRVCARRLVVEPGVCGAPGPRQCFRRGPVRAAQRFPWLGAAAAGRPRQHGK